MKDPRDSSTRHFSIRASGKVQGVFYRATAAERARQLGLTGFVRNEPDGSVYMEAEGSYDAIAAFVQWARTGPSAARVSSCEVTEGTLKNFHSFDIQR